ncbi:hypothetical protein [Tomitella biformata]|uniref:hypothetical protein n=1 Tax=Tomitella biformata TaxID=630403 RepID=UPI00046704EF|nr:hypothetical protein [Tomitella biformata]
MHQLSFFAAESEPPEPADLSGLLAGPGQCVLSGERARISVVVEDLWRAEAIAELMAECALPGRRLDTEIGRSEEGRPLVRTELAPELSALSRSWVKGAAKTVPDGWTPSSRAQRAWALAAGRGSIDNSEDGHYLLGLDPHAPDTHQPLAGALARVGIAAVLIGPRGGGPALRITGHRRLARLAENIGEPPSGATAVGAWPVG